MTIDARLQSLGQRHRELDAQITTEMQHPSSNDLTLHALKRRKLAIKDEIRILEERKQTQ